MTIKDPDEEWRLAMDRAFIRPVKKVADKVQYSDFFFAKRVKDEFLAFVGCYSILATIGLIIAIIFLVVRR